MLAYLVSKAFSLIFGLLYPAFCSYKAVKTKDVKEYVNWMMYWIVFSIYTFLENFADMFIGFWFPFYYELKIIFLLWLLSPSARGGCTVYRRIVHPFLSKHEVEIEQFIANFKSQSSTMIIQAGFQGFRYASNLLMSSTIGEGLNNLGPNYFLSEMRKTFSLNDLNRERYPEDMPDMNGMHGLSHIVEEINQRNINGSFHASDNFSCDDEDLPSAISPSKRNIKPDPPELNVDGEGANEGTRTRVTRRKKESGEMYFLHKEDIPLIVSLLASKKCLPGVEELREESEMSDDDFFDCSDSSPHSIESHLESSLPKQAVKMVGKTRLQAFQNVELANKPPLTPPPITPRIHKPKAPDLPVSSPERLRVKKRTFTALFPGLANAEKYKRNTISIYNYNGKAKF